MGTRSLVEAYMKTEGYIVYLAEDSVRELAPFRRCKPDPVILDIMPAGMAGLETPQQTRRESAVYAKYSEHCRRAGHKFEWKVPLLASIPMRAFVQLNVREDRERARPT